MSCSSVLFSLFLMSPCGPDGSGDVNEAVAAALANSQRPEEDIAKDAGRKPAQVLSFFDIQPGMTVLDLFSGGGYYTEILNSLDFLYADAKGGWQAIDEASFLDKLCLAMKPGAIVGFIDHAANSDGDAAIVAQKLHRIDPQLVRDTFVNSCFSLKGEAGFLGNQDDDHSLSVFDKSVNGKSDRFVFKFVRD